MKRRSFFGAIGAAVVGPLVPASVVAATQPPKDAGGLLVPPDIVKAMEAARCTRGIVMIRMTDRGDG